MSGYFKKKAGGQESLFYWLGFDFFSWLTVLARYRFRIGWKQLPIAAAVTALSIAQTLLRCLEHLVYGKKIAATTINDPPVFIIGHWRSGTTLLHELMALDTRFTYPTTYECFSPHHFLVSGPIVRPLIEAVLPAKRLQDDMAIGFDRPQEDEFALCLLGVISPYMNYAFPQQMARHGDYYDIEKAKPAERERWEQTLLRFLKKITLARPRPIILKSPTHTFRVKTLLRLFPGARFVYIVRNPYDVFLSTLHLRKVLSRAISFQQENFTGLEESVFKVFIRMHQSFEKSRSLIPAGQLHTLRYEDLEKDPVGQLRALYSSLGLSGFDSVVPALNQYLAGVANHKKNSYSLTPELLAEITRRWGFFIRQYGYDLPE